MASRYSYSIDYKMLWENELGPRIVSRTGKNWLARSPFREDKHPSFSVNIESGLYNDFATRGGDAKAFISARYSLSLTEAAKYIHENYGNGSAGKNRCLSMYTSSNYLPIKYREYPVYASNAFKYIEIVEGGFYNRTLSLIKKVTPLEFIDFFERPGCIDCASSVYLHCKDLKKYRDSPDTGNGQGSLAGYNGPVKMQHIPFDFDSKEGFDRALSETRAFVIKLQTFGQNLLKDIRVYFSGYKGFHIVTNGNRYQNRLGSTKTPYKVKAGAQKLANAYASFDSSIYKRTGLIRITNTINSKSGLYKIPITLWELFNLSARDIKLLAENPRRESEVYK